MKARVLRMCALFFAVTGFIIFMVLYMKNVDGQVFKALSEPRTMFMIIVPFLPAVVLSKMADKAQKQFMKLLKTENKKAE